MTRPSIAATREDVANGGKQRPDEPGPLDGDVDVAPPSAGPSSGPERRAAGRHPVKWAVDCQTEDTFLYASITNISELGIFVRTDHPLAVGTRVTLKFQPEESASPFELSGVVQWVNPLRPLADNPNPGMGIHFDHLTAEDRERIVDVIHTIAYVRDGQN